MRSRSTDATRAHRFREDAIAVDTAVNTVGEGFAADEAPDEHALRFGFSIEPGARVDLVLHATVKLRASQWREP